MRSQTPVVSVTREQIDETQRLQVAMGAMYTQEHVDKLEREIQKANLLLIKVQSKWQQAQMSGSAGAAAAGETVDGGGSTPRPDWEEARERLPGLQVLPDNAALLFAHFLADMCRCRCRETCRHRSRCCLCLQANVTCGQPLNRKTGQVFGGNAGRHVAQRCSANPCQRRGGAA